MYGSTSLILLAVFLGEYSHGVCLQNSKAIKSSTLWPINPVRQIKTRAILPADMKVLLTNSTTKINSPFQKPSLRKLSTWATTHTPPPAKMQMSTTPKAPAIILNIAGDTSQDVAEVLNNLGYGPQKLAEARAPTGGTVIEAMHQASSILENEFNTANEMLKKQMEAVNAMMGIKPNDQPFFGTRQNNFSLFNDAILPDYSKTEVPADINSKIDSSLGSENSQSANGPIVLSTKNVVDPVSMGKDSTIYPIHPTTVRSGQISEKVNIPFSNAVELRMASAANNAVGSLEKEKPKNKKSYEGIIKPILMSKEDKKAAEKFKLKVLDEDEIFALLMAGNNLRIAKTEAKRPNVMKNDIVNLTNQSKASVYEGRTKSGTSAIEENGEEPLRSHLDLEDGVTLANDSHEPLGLSKKIETRSTGKGLESSPQNIQGTNEDPETTSPKAFTTINVRESSTDMNVKPLMLPPGNFRRFFNSNWQNLKEENKIINQSIPLELSVDNSPTTFTTPDDSDTIKSLIKLSEINIALGRKILEEEIAQSKVIERLIELLNSSKKVKSPNCR